LDTNVDDPRGGRLSKNLAHRLQAVHIPVKDTLEGAALWGRLTAQGRRKLGEVEGFCMLIVVELTQTWTT
jgi:hypothetical protein